MTTIRTSFFFVQAKKNIMETGYWAVQGLGQPMRLLIAQTGEKWTDKKYTMENAQEWFAQDKPEVGKSTKFPNLPYLKDGDFTVTQSGAILRYLGDKFGYMGKDVKTRANSEILFGVLFDLWQTFYKLQTSGENYAKNKAETLEKIKTTLGPVCAHLKQNKFMAGDDLTWVDFYAIYELTLLSSWSNDIKKMPEIASYLENTIAACSDSFKAYWQDTNDNLPVIMKPYWQWGDKPMNQLEAETF